MAEFLVEMVFFFEQCIWWDTVWWQPKQIDTFQGKKKAGDRETIIGGLGWLVKCREGCPQGLRHHWTRGTTPFIHLKQRHQHTWIQPLHHCRSAGKKGEQENNTTAPTPVQWLGLGFDINPGGGSNCPEMGGGHGLFFKGPVRNV